MLRISIGVKSLKRTCVDEKKRFIFLIRGVRYLFYDENIWKIISLIIRY